jgi:hypothetical protein
MNKQLRDEWVKALRSGEYEQCRGTISKQGCDGPMYCCLGVLAHLIDGDDKALWGRVQKEAYGLPVSRYVYEELVGLNDMGRLPFTAIADWIEQNIPVTP